MALDHSCQVQRHPLSERGNDAYMTPPCATEALLRVEKDLPRRIWECACGDGTGILDVLRAAGHEVIGSDIGNFGRPDCFWERDFLGETRMPAGCTTIHINACTARADHADGGADPAGLAQQLPVAY